MIKLIRHGLLTLLTIVPLTACSETYTYEGKAIKGQVVDAESKRALEGAVVVALWAKRGGLHTDTIGYVHLDEAVTDSAGRYELKAWGPVEISGAYMGSFSPDLILFKQGYKYLRVNEGFLPPAKDRRVWTSKWDGKVIELENVSQDIYKNKQSLNALNSHIYRIRRGEERCEWQMVPHFLVEIHNAELEIKRKIGNKKEHPVNSPNMNNFYTIEKIWNQDVCGSAEKFFSEYLNEK